MPAITRLRPLPTPAWPTVGHRDAPSFDLSSGSVAAVPGSPPLDGRWSFRGDRPCALLTGKFDGPDCHLTLTFWRSPDGQVPVRPVVRTWTDDPFDALRQLQAAYQTDPPAMDDPPPFCGGLVGYFGYETAHACEQLPGRVRDALALPDLAFLVVDDLVAHDNITGSSWLIAAGRGQSSAAAQLDVEWRLDTLEVEWSASRGRRPAPSLAPADSASGLLRPPGSGPLQTPRDTRPLDLQGVQAQFTRQEYCAAVEHCREAILAGRIFEVCLTQQMSMEFAGKPWDLYRTLGEINPAPYAACLDLPGFAVVSASPERFLKLYGDGMAESRPIKGTAPRGHDPETDAVLRDGLAASAKDRAENVMIVDLVRNDLGRVCVTGSVKVPELCVLESYPTVHQMVSTIRGRLAPGRDALDLVRACFPGGSMTGAPKVEAMKLIDEVEQTTRGVYAGALGYLDRRGTMDLAIVIRTLVCKDGRAWLGTGGAITADSDPGAEYDETLAKARALIQAVQSSRTVRDGR